MNNTGGLGRTTLIHRLPEGGLIKSKSNSNIRSGRLVQRDTQQRLGVRTTGINGCVGEKESKAAEDPNHTELFNMYKRQAEKFKEKAENRKQSLKILFGILHDKEKENEDYKRFIEGCQTSIVNVCQEVEQLYSTKLGLIAGRVDEHSEKVMRIGNSLKQAIELKMKAASQTKGKDIERRLRQDISPSIERSAEGETAAPKRSGNTFAKKQKDLLEAQYENQVAELTNKVDELTDMVSNLTKYGKEAKTECEELQRAVQKKDREIRELEESHGKELKRAEKERLQVVNGLKEEIKQLSVRLEANVADEEEQSSKLRAQVKKLEKELRDLRESSQAIEKESVKEAQGKSAKELYDLQQLVDDLRSQYRDLANSTEGELEKKDFSIQNLREEVKSQEVMIRQLKEDSAKLKDLSAKREAGLEKSLSDRLAEGEKRIQELTHQNNGLKKEVKLARQDKESSNKHHLMQMEELELQHKQAIQEIESEYIENVASKDEAIKSQEKDIKTLEEEISLLKKKEKDALSILEISKQEVQDLKERHKRDQDRLQEELDQAFKRINEKTDQMNPLVVVEKELRSKCSELQKSVDKQEAMIRQQSADLIKAKQEQENSHNEASEKNKKLEDQMSKLKADLERSVEDLNSMKSKWLASVEENNSICLARDKLISLKDQETKQLKDCLKVASDSLQQQTSNSAKTLEEERNRAQVLIAAEKSIAKQLEVEILALKNNIQQQTVELSELGNQVSNLTQENERLRSQQRPIVQEELGQNDQYDEPIVLKTGDDVFGIEQFKEAPADFDNEMEEKKELMPDDPVEKINELEALLEEATNLLNSLHPIFESLEIEPSEDKNMGQYVEEALEKIEHLKSIFMEKEEECEHNLQQAIGLEQECLRLQEELQINKDNLKSLASQNESDEKYKNIIAELSRRSEEEKGQLVKEHQALMDALNQDIKATRERAERAEIQASQLALQYEKDSEEVKITRNKIASVIEETEAEKKKCRDLNNINQLEFERLSREIINAKEDADKFKDRSEILNKKYSELQQNVANLKADVEQGEKFREKYETVSARLEKDGILFGQNLASKLEEVNRLTSENEKLKEKLKALNEKSRETQNRQSLEMGREGQGSTLEVQLGGSSHESEENIEKLRKQLETKCNEIQLLQDRLGTYERGLKDERTHDTKGKVSENATDDEMAKTIENLKLQISATEKRLKVSVEEIDNVKQQNSREVSQLRREYEQRILEQEENLESTEANLLRELSEKTLTISKLKEEFETKINAKEQEIFYIRREFEQTNSQKETDWAAQHQKSNNPQANAKGDLEGMGKQKEQGIEKLRKLLQEKEQRLEECTEEVAQLGRINRRLLKEVEDGKRLSSHNFLRDGSQGNAPKDQDSKEAAQGSIEDASVEDLEELSLSQLRSRLMEAKSIEKGLRQQIQSQQDLKAKMLQDYDYIHTESDFRLGQEETNGKKQSQPNEAVVGDAKLIDQISNLVRVTLNLSETPTRWNILEILSNKLSKWGGRSSGLSLDIAEKLEELQTDNQQLKKEVMSLNTQNSHLKEVLLKHRPPEESENNFGAILKLVNRLVVEFELSPLQSLSEDQLKDAVTGVLKWKRRVDLELRSKGEMIEELKLTSVKIFSDRDSEHISGKGEEYNRMKELLTKYHSLRKKHEGTLSEMEQLEMRRLNQEFEAEDLARTLEIEGKKREALEIQVELLKRLPVEGSDEVKAHIKILLQKLFQELTETRNGSEFTQLLDIVTSVVGYSQDEKKLLTEAIKRSKVFDKVWKKK